MNEIILTSSVLILIVVALRYILKGRIAPTLQYALWLLVAARLLIPGTLFTAPVTIVGLAEEVQDFLAEPAEDGNMAAQSPSIPVYIPGQVITIIPEPAPDLNMPPVSTSPTLQAPGSPSTQAISVDWVDVIWKTGIVAVSMVFLISNLVFYRKLLRTRRRISDAELPVVCPIPVYYVNNLSAPCLFGNTIYVNKKALHEKRLRHVLSHELTHRRHGDHFWALLRCACLAIHWYNPLVWLAAALSRRDCELSCDSAVISRLGDSSGISYGETLMAMLTTSPTNLLHTATTMSASKRTMAERLKMIVRRPKMMKLTAAVLALVTICTVIFTFGGCADETVTPDPDKEITDNTGSTQTEDDETLTPPENGFGYIPITNAIYTHPSGLFTLELPPNWSQGLVLRESEDGVSIYDSRLYTENGEDGWILSVLPQPADFGYTKNPFLTLAAFDPNGTAQVYILEYDREYSGPFSFLQRMISDTFTLSASSQQFSRLIHESFEDNIALAISYLPYLSWRNYREVYGDDAVTSLLGALWQFAETGTADWNQYHDFLSISTDGLDGAYDESLTLLFSTLLNQNKKQFTSVINSIYITAAERARVAKYVDYPLGAVPIESDSDNAVFTDSQMILGANRAYAYKVQTIGTPTNLTVKLRNDWTLDSIRSAISSAVTEYIRNTDLETDLSDVVISYSFRFPEEMKEGTVLTVRYCIRYTDTDPYELPSGENFYPEGITEELTAEVKLVGDGTTAPVSESFAKGQAVYDLVSNAAKPEDVIEVSRSGSFDFYDIVCSTARAKLAEAGLSDVCYLTGFSSGGYHYPIWCEPGFEQTITYSLTFLYTDDDISCTFTFTYTVTVITTE